MTAEATVQAVIAAATAAANIATDKAIQYSDKAQTVASGTHSAGDPLTVHRPNVVLPAFDPTIDLTGDFLREYNAAVADYDPAFQSQITGFIDKYCPNLVGCLKTAMDGWICSSIEDGGTGMKPNVENAIWQRGRDREIIDSRRVIDEAVSGIAARGWSLPGGVLLDAVQRAKQAAADKASTINRDVMIKQADIEIENIRFAIGEGIKLRLGVISALLTYLGAWVSLRQIAIDKARALLDAKTRLYQSVAAYYGAIIDAARLVLEYEKINADNRMRLIDTEGRDFAHKIESKVGAAISAAETMGAIAAAALGAQNTLAEVAHNTSVSAES